MKYLVTFGWLTTLVLSSPIPDGRFYPIHRNPIYYGPPGFPYDPSGFYLPYEAYAPPEPIGHRLAGPGPKQGSGNPLTVQLVLNNVPEGASVSVSVTVNGKPAEILGSPLVTHQPVNPPVEPVTPPAPEEEEGGSISIEVQPEESTNGTESSTEDMVIAISSIDPTVHFPDSIASPESNLDNREPSPPLAPGGIISSNQPTVITAPFENPKDSPLLIALQAAAVRNQ